MGCQQDYGYGGIDNQQDGGGILQQQVPPVVGDRYGGYLRMGVSVITDNNDHVAAIFRRGQCRRPLQCGEGQQRQQGRNDKGAEQ